MATTRRTVVILALIAAVVMVLSLRPWSTHGTRSQSPPLRRTPRSEPRIARPSVTGASVAVRAVTARVERSDGPLGLATFAGTVRSLTTGLGVAHASVIFEREGVTRAVHTAPDGGFSFTPDAEGAWSLALVTAEGYVAWDPIAAGHPVRLDARRGVRLTAITLVLEPRMTYTVTVVDATGAPVEGAVVRVVDGDVDAQHTDARGELRIAAHDGATLEARHPAWRPARARLDIAEQVSRRVQLRLGDPHDGGAFEQRASMRGCVIAPEGAACDDAVVRVSHGAPPSASVVRVGADGCFVLDDLDTGEHVVTVHAAGCAPWRGVLRTGDDARIALVYGAHLRGVVRGADGAPLAGSTVVASLRVGAVETAYMQSATSYDAAGRYALALAPGRYVLTAVAEGHAPAPEVSLDVEGDVTQDFTLTGGGRCTGEVVDAVTQRPIEGARLSLEGRTGDGTVPLLASARTDAHGRFALTGMAPGVHGVTVAAVDHHVRVISGLSIVAGEELGPLRWALTPVAPGESPRVELVGVGAVLRGVGDDLRVEEVVPGGGAAEVGIAAGDIVHAVDDVPVSTVGFQSAIQRIRGPEGSTVTLVIVRDGGTLRVVAPRRRIVR